MFTEMSQFVKITKHFIFVDYFVFIAQNKNVVVVEEIFNNMIGEFDEYYKYKQLKANLTDGTVKELKNLATTIFWMI